MNTTTKVLQIKTESPTHIVVRNSQGYKIFEVNLPGVTVTVAVPSEAEIKVEPKEGER